MKPERETLAACGEFFPRRLLRFACRGNIIPVSEQDSQGCRDAGETVQRLFLRALVRDRHLADDVVQETFLTVLRKAGDFEPGTNFPRWACSVARLKVMEAHRREKGRLVFLSDEAIEALAGSVEGPVTDVRTEVLESCIAELPPSMQRAIELRYLGEHKPGEIARITGWTAEAVYVGLSRARSLLRDCVARKLLNLNAADEAT
jgi:RNA polymerase sigma-70 factor, ECF subfamily